tara:strand:- start:2249 stop:3004 length:756 start_codon:yes stop_codon:yes gene_type:complete
VKRLIALLLVSTIGFSQDCENSVLDEVLMSEEVNQYFQMALSLSLDDLAFLNNCDDTTTYTIFAPGNDVPTASITPLLGAGGELIEYILYYITNLQIDISYVGWEGNGGNTNMEMMDGNQAVFSCGVDPDIGGLYALVNDVSLSDLSFSNPICACNGSIYILDDLIWAPGVNLEENSQSLSLYPNPAKNLLNVSKVVDLGVLELVDMNGKVLLSKEIDTDIPIDVSNYKKGIYLINFISEKEGFTQMIAIN